MVAKFSRQQSTQGEGIEILVNEPYEDDKGKGQFTHKRIYLGRYYFIYFFIFIFIFYFLFFYFLFFYFDIFYFNFYLFLLFIK